MFIGSGNVIYEDSACSKLVNGENASHCLNNNNAEVENVVQKGSTSENGNNSMQQYLQELKTCICGEVDDITILGSPTEIALLGFWLSLDGFPVLLYDASITNGSFRARVKGISILCAAANNDPTTLSFANEAAWIAPIGASALDRKFTAVAQCHLPVCPFLIFYSDQ